MAARKKNHFDAVQAVKMELTDELHSKSMQHFEANPHLKSAFKLSDVTKIVDDYEPILSKFYGQFGALTPEAVKPAVAAFITLADTLKGLADQFAPVPADPVVADPNAPVAAV